MLKKISLKVKLIILFLLVGLLPLGVIALLSYNSAREEIRSEVYKGLDMYSILSKESMDTYFEEIYNDANVMATTRDIYQSFNVLAGTGYNTSDPAWTERTKIMDNLMEALAEDKGYTLIYLSDMRGKIVYSTNRDFLGKDMSGRAYLQGSLQGSTTWSELFFSDLTNTNIMAVSAPVRSMGRTGNVLGTINLVVDDQNIAYILQKGLAELGESANAYLLNETGLLLSNTKLGEYSQGAALQRSINTRAVEILSDPIRNGNWDFNTNGEYQDYLGNSVLGALFVAKLGEEPVGLVIEIGQNEAFQGVTQLRSAIIPLIAVSAVVIAFVAFFVAMTIVRPVQKVSDMTKVLAKGDFTVRAEIKSRDELGLMAKNLNGTVDILSETLARVQDASDNVSHASAELSSGNQDLSQRTEEQASSLEEVSSTIEEVTSSLESCSSHAGEADNLSRQTMDSVRKGEEVVRDMQDAMSEITRCSQEISEIISTVNDIAFQTNLLALNAAVEAARAGEQGRGFAVVAAEVRNLAGRSAESAKEIEKLIKDTIVRVEKGNRLMGDTEKVLQEIVSNTQNTSDVVGEIAASLREQSTAAGDIRTAIEELNQVTQQNASLVEEIAGSSENMNSEAVELYDRIKFFKISTNGYKKVERKTEVLKQGETARKAVTNKKPALLSAAAKSIEPDFFEEDFEKF